MKVKKMLTCLAVLFSLFFGTTASAANYTLYFDWEKDFTFSSTSLSINFSTMTFTTGDGYYGDVETVGGTLALIFRNGCCPLYTGPVYGFMDCRDGSCANDPGYWYIGPPTSVESLELGGRSSGGD
jgi:hypothetical protein